MREVTVARTASRTVLGVMTELAFVLGLELRGGERLPLPDLSRALSRVRVGRLPRGIPAEDTIELFRALGR